MEFCLRWSQSLNNKAWQYVERNVEFFTFSAACRCNFHQGIFIGIHIYRGIGEEERAFFGKNHIHPRNNTGILAPAYNLQCRPDGVG
jgi:hypothetical protein